MPSSTIKARLAALEAERDRRIDRLWDRYYVRESALIGADFHDKLRARYPEGTSQAVLEADPDVQAGQKLISSDPEIAEIWAVLGRAEWYADYVNRFILRKQPNEER